MAANSMNCNFYNCKPGPCSDMANITDQEKRNLHSLNDRLTQYLNQVRSLRSQGGNCEPAYQEAIRGLEKDLENLRCHYENEIMKLRQELDKCRQINTSMAAEIEAKNRIIVQLQSQLQDENGKYRNCAKEMEDLRRALADRDKQIADLRACLASCDKEVSNLRPQLEKCCRDLSDANARADCEAKNRLSLEERCRQLSDELKREQDKNQRLQAEYLDRIRAQQEIIACLERKIAELSRPAKDDLGPILQKLRDATAEEMRRYKVQMDNALCNATNDAAKMRDADNAEKNALRQELSNIKNMLMELKKREADLLAQLKACREQNEMLKAALDQERANCAAKIGELERKLAELQQELMCKLKDCNAAKEAQINLKHEIDTYRALLENEEQRLARAPKAQETCIQYTPRVPDCVPLKREMDYCKTIPCGPSMNYNSAPLITKSSSGCGCGGSSSTSCSCNHNSYPIKGQNAYSAPSSSRDPILPNIGPSGYAATQRGPLNWGASNNRILDHNTRNNAYQIRRA